MDDLAHVRTGAGPPLVLVHGVGSNRRMWDPVMDRLAAERDVVALDLPGHGDSPADGRPATVAALAGAVAELAAGLGLAPGGWHVAGNSLGGGIALELGRRGHVASVCALSPVGFATPRERAYGHGSLVASRALARALAPVAGAVTAGAVRRALISGQLAGQPARIPPADAAHALRGLAAAPGFDQALEAGMAYRAVGPGPACPTTIAWGDRDRLLLFAARAPAPGGCCPRPATWSCPAAGTCRPGTTRLRSPR